MGKLSKIKRGTLAYLLASPNWPVSTWLIRWLGGVCQVGLVSCCSARIGELYVRISTRSGRISPLGRIFLTGGGASFGEHRIHRFISDFDHKYFGYDLLFDSAEGGAVYRLAFEPLSLKPSQCLPARFGIYQRGLEQLPLEQLPPPQMLRLGHELEVKLATADGKHKIIERINFSAK